MPWRNPIIRWIAVALISAVIGFLVNGTVMELRIGAQLATIELRLTNLERNVNSITCLEAVGTTTCDPHADHHGSGT